MMKKTVIIMILLLSCKIVSGQDKTGACDNDNNDRSYFYRPGKLPIYTIDTLPQKEIDIVRKIEQFITVRDLKNLFVLKKDENFRKIAEENCRETDFSFPTVEDMFEACKIDISPEYNSAKLQLDTSFMQKNLFAESQIAKVAFFHFDKECGIELYLYNYVYPHSGYFSPYTLHAAMVISPSHPYDDVFDKNLIRIEETEKVKMYAIPVTYETENIYAYVVFIKR